jgi:hypothetical protein
MGRPVKVRIVAPVAGVSFFIVIKECISTRPFCQIIFICV